MENTDEFLFVIVYRVWKPGIPFIIEAAQLVATHSTNDGKMCVIPSAGRKRMPSTPDNYYRRFMRGEIQKKDTFSGRVLTTDPKFVQKRKADKAKNVVKTASSADVSTLEKDWR